MTDYIERDVWKSMPDDLPYKASVKRVLMQAPAADVRPVVRGWWLNGHCTSCGEDVASFLDTWTDIQRFLYCPYCGSLNEVG